MLDVRPAAVAGMFYPDNGSELEHDLADFLAQARSRSAQPAPAPKALIVPHAGYIYSGPIAAYAYTLMEPLRERIRRVVLLGPAHRVAVRGLALPGWEAFATPLGTVTIDREAVAAVRDLPQVVESASAHALEHSLEVQLPFLQTVLADFRLVPFAVGDASAEEVAEVLERLWGGDETLIVISSDLSHYHPYAEAKQIDRATADDILKLTLLSNYEQACGATPINGLLLQAQRRRLAPRLLDLRNSGDTAGERSRVVGYAAFALHEESSDVH